MSGIPWRTLLQGRHQVHPLTSKRNGTNTIVLTVLLEPMPHLETPIPNSQRKTTRLSSALALASTFPAAAKPRTRTAIREPGDMLDATRLGKTKLTCRGASTFGTLQG